MFEDLNFRVAKHSDIEWLVKLRIKTMSAYLLAAHEYLSEEEQRARVVQDFESIQIILRNSMDIGMLKVVKHPSNWKLVQIQLQPESQGSGIGRYILEQLIEETRAKAVSLSLSVLKVNPAKHLYDRLGFYVVKEKNESYEMQIDP
ncbi:MAG: GNAT family N-acetyltransferase [Pseudomonadales bacterium]|nr:GNAT family N-acetyltransferase [Pseudomonadales bacterium]